MLWGTTAASVAYVASILFSYRRDMFAASANRAATLEDKTPVILRRTSIQNFLAKTEAA